MTEVERFRQKVYGPQLHGFNCPVDGPERRQHDDRWRDGGATSRRVPVPPRVRIPVSEALQDFDSRHDRQFQIKQNQRWSILLNDGQSLSPILCRHSLMTAPFEALLNTRENIGVV